MKEKLTCYIIDDEPLAREILKEYISKVPFLNLLGSFPGAVEASAKMDHDKPDLLFLDINMPDLDGLSFISMLNNKPMIILTTAYDRYALQSYELEVKDYLLKPISFERFYKGVLRLFQGLNNQTTLEKREVTENVQSESEFIFIKVGYRIQKIDIKDILFIQGMRDYLQLHTRKEKVMTLLSFAKLEEQLPMNKFARVHKSYLIAIDKIDHIENNRIKIGDHLIPIGETYKDLFFDKLKT